MRVDDSVIGHGRTPSGGGCLETASEPCIRGDLPARRP